MTADPDPRQPETSSLHFPRPGAGTVRVGVDTVHIPRIAESLSRHGERFMQRLFTPAERAYAMAAPLHTAERLAARFAAKEAVIKALSLSEVGVDWCDIEVMRDADGACTLSLHGRAAEQARQLGVRELALSLSHDGGQAIAMVVALRSPNTDPTRIRDHG
ncbi:MAG: holo-ACP synthase [Burkholderiales bacterium]